MAAPSPNRQKRCFERHPKKTIFFLGALLFIALDLGLAQFWAERIPNIKNAYYHHDLAANYRGILAYGPYKYEIITNSLGFKDHSNRTIAKINDKYRILFMGDSFAEGVGFAYDDTFVGMIAKKLDNSTYEVLNAGVSSYSPKLYYLKIKYLIDVVGLKVDEIFVYIDISDITDEIEYEHFTPSDANYWNFYNRMVFIIKRNSLVGNVVIKEIIKIRRDLVFRTMYRDDKKITSNVSENQGKNGPLESSKYWENQDEYLRDRAAWTHNEEIFHKWGRKGLSLAEENLDKLNELCKKNNIKLTIAVYPWPEEIKYHNVNSRNVMVWKKFCQERDINYLNCYPYFFTGEKPEIIIGKYYITGDAHFNLEGQRLMAKIWLGSYNSTNFHQVR